MKVSVLTLGCKVNKYESDVLLELFKQKGYEISDKLEWADIYVINSCAVTGEAERKSRQMISRCQKFNSKAEIYVCGCASQHNPSQFGSKVKLVKGTAGKVKISDLCGSGIEIDELCSEYESSPFSFQPNLRSYIKVQDGCNNFCSYCIIPYLRGRSRSRELSEILLEAKSLPTQIKEIVLTGINLSDFKIDGKPGLLQLLKSLDALGKRLRLSSMEEVIANEQFIKELSLLKNFCPHFHLSLQSGSPTVLKRMNRRYAPEQFEKTCQNIRKYFPQASITTDVIVGFPDESESEFNETVNFIKKINFSSLHIFPFSRREGTVAANMKDLPSAIKKQRVKLLKSLDEKLRENFVAKNKKGLVLVEEYCDGLSVGHTENYIKCFINERLLPGEIVEVEILKPYQGGALAKIICKNA